MRLAQHSIMNLFPTGCDVLTVSESQGRINLSGVSVHRFGGASTIFNRKKLMIFFSSWSLFQFNPDLHQTDPITRMGLLPSCWQA